MWVWLKLKLTPKGDFCEVSVFFLQISLCTALSDTWMSILVTFRPKQRKWDQNLQTTSTHVPFVWESSCGSRSPSVPLDFSQDQWLPSFESIGSASLSSDLHGWQVSWWEVMVSWHFCTFISWEKPRERPHYIFLLLPLMLHCSKLMLKLYYLRVSTSLLTGCDTKVTLDSGLSLVTQRKLNICLNLS